MEEIRQVPREQAEHLGYQHGMLETLETSAKDNTNINEAFLRMARVSW